MKINTQFSKSKKIGISILFFCILAIIIYIIIKFTILNNLKVGNIEVICINQNNQPIIGEKIILKNSKNENIGEAQTGKDGIIIFNNVQIGDYTLEVSEVKDGYLPKDYSKSLTITNNSTFSITFEHDWKYGKLEATVLNDNNLPMQNSNIEIYDENGYIISTLTSDENGKVYCDLNSGTFYFKQTSTFDGYTMDNTLYKLVINDENKTFFQNIINKQHKGNFVLSVTDSNNTPLNEIKFNILDSNRNNIITITTNNEGLTGVKNLPLGTYFYQCTDSKYNSEMHEFTIESNEQVVRNDIKI